VGRRAQQLRSARRCQHHAAAAPPCR
jgi:hypothetical protein